MNNICILVFAYNRRDRLKALLNSLRNQDIRGCSVAIFSDGSRSCLDSDDVRETRMEIEENADIFDRVVFQTQNIGLRESIISGCNWASMNYDGFIVLEDDLVLMDGAISYLKKMLEVHKNDLRIGHLNLWSLPQICAKAPYYTSFMSCWGWATWSNRWNANLADVLSIKLSFLQRVRLSKCFSTSHYSHFYANQNNIRRTWAVLWMVNLQLKHQKIIAPPFSLCINSGLNEGSHVDEILKDITQLSSSEKGNLFRYEVFKSKKNQILNWYYNFRYHRKLTLLRSFVLMVVAK